MALYLGNEDLRDLRDMVQNGFVRVASGEGNNIANPTWGAAGAEFIRLTDPYFTDGADGRRETALTPREISDLIANQDNDGDGIEESIPNAFNGSALLTFFGQYFDHGLDFVAKGANGAVAIGSAGFPISAARSNIVAGTGIDPDGIPNSGDEIAAQYINNVSPFVDQNQAYGSQDAVTDLLREWVVGTDGSAQQTAYLLKGDLDATGRALLPTLDHIRENYRIMTGGNELTSEDIADYDNSGQALLLDFIPVFKTEPGMPGPVLDLDAIGHYFIAGDGRLNENVMLTSIHTIWARNHNFWVDELKASTGGQWSEAEYFEAARIMNVSEYQRIVFTEFAEAMGGGLSRDDGNPNDPEHGFDKYDPTVNAAISVEFAQAAYRFGHSMLNETVSYADESGVIQQMSLVDAFLRPQTLVNIGIDNLMAGAVVERHQAIDVDMVNALRNQLVGRPLDLAALNIFRGRDMGIAPFNDVRAQLFAQTGLTMLRPYTGWDDFQTRNALSDALIASFKAAYPEGFHTVDLWIGGLAEKPQLGQLGSTFGYIFNEQLDRLQHGDRFYYLEILDDSIFQSNPISFADLLMRNTGLTDLPSNVFLSGVIDPPAPTAPPIADEDDDTPPGDTPPGDTGPDDDDPAPEQPDTNGPGTPTAPPVTATVLFGTTGADNLVAGRGRDMVFGLDGDDILIGNAGADMLFGDAGADRIFGGDGDDYINGGSGNDLIFGGEGNDIFVAEVGDGDDVYHGDAGTDLLDMSAITANIVADLGTGFMMRGQVHSAQTGFDVLWGVENIITGSGNDIITASVAVNIMDGGDGNDTFRFLSSADADGDVIYGFQPGDRIDLSAMDADATAAGKQGFVLVPSGVLTGPGQVAFTHQTTADGEYTVVAGNTTGGAEADFRINIKGHHTLTTDDFTL